MENKYPIGGYAPGNYTCKCVTCEETFQGDKRAVQCEPCAVKEQEWISPMQKFTKKNNIIDAWLEKNGDPIIEKKVEEEAEELMLENAAERLYPDGESFFIEQKAFKVGAKWMAERMYSEEEVRKAIDYGAELGLNDNIGNSFQWRNKQDKWFENNKNK